MKIVLMVRALDPGGAETQLVALAQGLRARGNAVVVVSFYGGGALEKELASTQVPYRPVGKRGRWDVFGFMARAVSLIRDLKPDVVYSSMPAANLLAVAVSALAGRPRIAWRLASSDMDLSAYDWLTRATYRMEAILSRVPKGIVANAEAGRRVALNRGYPPGRLSVITNGIDTARFQRQPRKGIEIRRRWGLEPARWVIGQVARADPKKDYPTFIEAAGILCSERDDVRFLCVGVKPGRYTDQLEARARDRGLEDRIVWRGVQSDMSPVYSAMDINTLSSSFGEGFPNAVAEAMACGAPCVVTDVGDSANIVGDTGRVVPVRSPDQLAQSWIALIEELGRREHELRSEARRRIETNFSLDEYVERTEQFLYSLD